MATGDLTPVVQRTLGSEAAARLRAAIRSGALPPGARLVERDLAERLGMSRIPVREAIQRLVEEGLVTKIPHRGTFVYAPTRKEIEEIASLRVVLERFVVERVMARWKPEHEVRLRQIVDKMRQARLQRDSQQISELDTQFHHTLWEIADHGILLEVASSLRARISRFLYDTISISVPNSEFEAILKIHVDGHEDLIQVLKSGDVAAAQEAYAQHILGGEARILAFNERFGVPQSETPAGS